MEERCYKHSESSAVALCALCDRPVCSACTQMQDDLSFCGEHYEFYKTNAWPSVITVKSSASNYTQGVRLYDLRTRLREEFQILTYLGNSYQLDEASNEILTMVSLFAKQADHRKILSLW